MSRTVSIRLPQSDEDFIRDNAAKHKKSVQDYLRSVISKGIVYDEISEAVEAVGLLANARSDGLVTLAESIFEIRNYLRVIVSKEDPDLVNEAKTKAKDMAEKLFGAKNGD